MRRIWFLRLTTFIGAAFTLASPLSSSCPAAEKNATPGHTDVHSERLFAVKVLPLLTRKCFACHGGDVEDRQGEFDMRSRASMLGGGESGEPALVPGDPDASPLYLAIQWDGLEMPPKENDRLTPEEIEWIRAWIAGGAPWPNQQALSDYRQMEWGAEHTEEGVLVATSGGLTDEWTYRRYEPESVWAFQPVVEPTVPSGAPHPIDAFVADKLKETEIDPARRADPRALLRRATYDLIGLPPTPGEIANFLAAWEQDSQAAWRDLIERLLASPHYGERWAQHWLDVVRYADTSGYSNDWERSNAWRYRDYVIRSFNNDKPYDRFIMEQIAGDELEPANPEMLVAVGFLRAGPWEHTLMSPAKVSRQLYLDDVVNSIGQSFLSTAMRCSKCHDHKFDPIPTRDYYRLYAALATTQPAERPADFLAVEDISGFEASRQHVETLLEFAIERRDELYAKREAAARNWYAQRGREKDFVDFNRRRLLTDEDKPRRFIGLTTEEEGILKVREQDVRIWTRRLERFEPLAQSVYSGGNLDQESIKLRMPDPQAADENRNSEAVPETSIYAGGSVFTPTSSVTPGVLSGLQLATAAARDNDRYALPRSMQRRRLELARWIADPHNSLATRSIANRIWHFHFGRGLAGNPNNFGASGKRPTHPKLLDWLAAKFVEQGWSIKWLHRLIMTSQTYQRASRHADVDTLRIKDPNNNLLAVFEPRRLTAEEVRDAMLAASGELNPQQGGLPIMPEMNIELALAPRMIQFSLAPAWQPSRTPEERNRRSIYAYRIRGLPDPLMEVFNKPGADDSCERRDTASVTPQVFTLMNSDFVMKRSIAMAIRLEREANTTAARIRLGCELAMGRAASPDTTDKLLQHYEAMVAYHEEHEPEPDVYPRRVTRSLVEEFSGDTFEYEELLDIYDNYVSDIQAADVSPRTRALADICMLLFNSNAFIYVY